MDSLSLFLTQTYEVIIMTYEEFKQFSYIYKIQKYVPTKEIYDDFFKSDIIKKQDNFRNVLRSLYYGYIVQCSFEVRNNDDIEFGIYKIVEKTVSNKLPSDFKKVVSIEEEKTKYGTTKITYKKKRLN